MESKKIETLEELREYLASEEFSEILWDKIRKDIKGNPRNETDTPN